MPNPKRVPACGPGGAEPVGSNDSNSYRSRKDCAVFERGRKTSGQPRIRVIRLASGLRLRLGDYALLGLCA